MKMSIEMTSGRKILFLITLFLTTIIPMADFVIIPVIPNFYKDFADNINLVNYAVSGPTLAMLVSSLLTGKLIKLMSKKNIMIIGTAIFAVSSIFCIAVYNIYFIAVMRTFIGFTYGLMMVTSYALIAELFTDEKLRGTMLGGYTASMSAMGIILGLLSGFVASQKWQWVFNIYWVAVPLLILVILFIPNTGKLLVETASIGNKEEKKNTISVMPFVALCASAVVLGAICNIFIYFIGVFVAENGIGDATASGIMASTFMLGALFASLIFGFTYRKMKKGLNILSFLFVALSYFLMYLFPNYVVSIIGCIIIGAAYGNTLSYYPMRTTVIVAPHKVSSALGVTNAAIGLGTFVSTFEVTLIQSIIKVDTFTGIMPVLAGIATIGVVVAVILTIRSRTHPSEYII